MVAGVARVERDREQALLAARLDQAADVEERLSAQLAVDEHADHARLLDDVELARLAARRGYVDRRVEAAGERLQRQRGRAALTGGCPGRRDGDQHGPDPPRGSPV